MTTYQEWAEQRPPTTTAGIPQTLRGERASVMFVDDVMPPADDPTAVAIRDALPRRWNGDVVQFPERGTKPYAPLKMSCAYYGVHQAWCQCEPKP